MTRPRKKRDPLPDIRVVTGHTPESSVPEALVRLLETAGWRLVPISGQSPVLRLPRQSGRRKVDEVTRLRALLADTECGECGRQMLEHEEQCRDPYPRARRSRR